MSDSAETELFSAMRKMRPGVMVAACTLLFVNNPILFCHPRYTCSSLPVNCTVICLRWNSGHETRFKCRGTRVGSIYTPRFGAGKPSDCRGMFVGDIHRLISDQLTLVPSEQSRYLLAWFLIVVVIILVMALVILRRQFDDSLSTIESSPAPHSHDDDVAAPPTDDREDDSADAPPAADGVTAFEGPGAILAHLNELYQEFSLTAQDVRDYTGLREAQIQDWQRLCTEILRRMLPVLENLEPYLADADEQVAGLAQVVHGRLLTELMTVGVRVIAPVPGEPFNPGCHQLHPETTEMPPYQVKTLVAPGYLFRARVSGSNEVVLKPAEVIAETLLIEEPVVSTELEAGEELRSVDESPLPEELGEDLGNIPEEAVVPKTPSARAVFAEALSDEVAGEMVDAESLESPPLGGYDVLLTPLPTDEVDIEPSPTGAEDEESKMPNVHTIDDEDLFELWLEGEAEHKVWVVDENEDPGGHGGNKE